MSERNAFGCVIIALLFLPLLWACSDSKTKEEAPAVLTINEYQMTREAFQAVCQADLEFNEAYKTSMEGQKIILDRIIRKELLIQAAKKRGLDKQPEFMAAIERYWEATLIKLLMQEKGEEIKKTTLVTQKEIEAAYQAHKAANASLPPLSKIEKQIADQILAEKKTQALDKWIKSLYEKADIIIDEKIFTQ